ncbi:MAG: T9SS type A sorting domain-containing protein [Chitinophagales bacterium]|nr:T9SS type A sorting domain-containing protein [Chitinophagales bacterium]
MKTFLTALTALLASQLLSAQSLTPTTGISVGRVVTKPNARLTSSLGELKVKGSKDVPPLKTATKEEPAVMTVYPNPASGVVSFNFDVLAQGKVTVSLANTYGQKLADVYAADNKNGSITQTVDITNYAAGMYFLTLQYNDAAGKLHAVNRKFQIL